MVSAKFATTVSILTLMGLFLMPASLKTASAQSSDVDFDITLDHVALSVPDIGQSIAWYGKMFGFKEVSRGGKPHGTQIALIQRGNVRIELFQVPGAAPLPESRRNPSEDFRTNGLKHFAFQVKDVRAALAELQAKGVKVVFPLHGNPKGGFAFVSDNAGNAIELIQHKNK